tara:strand:+ start:1489 stop:1917 length:429 start_codon:yes stop_codon:yes gene_type:complete
MLEIIGSLLGFGASAVPTLINYFQDSKDKKHELAMHAKIAESNIREAEITGELANLALDLKADMESTRAAHQPMQLTGINWVDALRGSVRPLVTYWFMALYSYSKYITYVQGGDMWTSFDQTLLATVISFWFGERLIRKIVR